MQGVGGILKPGSVDAAILAALVENARISTTDLARRVGRSRTTVQSRVERLERDGVILGYTARLAAESPGAGVRAHVLIKLAPRAGARVEQAVRALPAVRELHAVSGEYDMIAIAVAPDVGQLDAIIDAIGAIEGVERTNSAVVLATKFDRWTRGSPA